MSKATEYETIWKVLSKVDVGEHTKPIGGGKFKLSYLSWAWAWGVVMEHFPHSEYSFTEFDNGSDVRYYSDGTCAVECTITIGALSRSMWLPVMDNRHKAVSSPNALQISNAKMRCLTKCLAMWGLGHYIYAGEDLPEVMSHPSQIKRIKEMLESDKCTLSPDEKDNALSYIEKDISSKVNVIGDKSGLHI